MGRSARRRGSGVIDYRSAGNDAHDDNQFAGRRQELQLDFLGSSLGVER